MKHEWKGGMTPSTPDSPPEGYCYCDNCGMEQDDDNKDEDCPIQYPRLFVWRPEGHGPKTFIVMSESQEQAEQAVREYISSPKDYDFDSGNWPEGHTLETYELNQVAENDND
jgi:hypothetical protein